MSSVVYVRFRVDVCKCINEIVNGFVSNLWRDLGLCGSILYVCICISVFFAAIHECKMCAFYFKEKISI